MLKELHSPSSSLVKDRLVVSSFRFLLKSMHRLLSFFLMVLISCDSRERSQVRPYIKLKNTHFSSEWVHHHNHTVQHLNHERRHQH